MKRQIFCTFPQDLIKEPFLFLLTKDFEVVPNILGASVTDEIAVLTLELEGDSGVIAEAIQWLRRKGVQVELIEGAQGSLS